MLFTKVLFTKDIHAAARRFTIGARAKATLYVSAIHSQQTKAAYTIVNTTLFAVAALVCQMSTLTGAQRRITTYHIA